MKHFGNTLYVTTQGIYVRRDGTNLVMSLAREEKFRLPIHTISSVVSFGNVMWTPFALGLCGENGVSVVFLTEQGRFLARTVGKQRGNVLLRRAQCERTNNPEDVSLAARAFVSGKIANARTVLMRARRDYYEKIDCQMIDRAVKALAQRLRALLQPLPVESVRGIEGDAAKIYFSVFDSLIVAQKEAFYFKERKRRPPTDNMNALLSFIYTLLANDVASACEAFGLDPQMGFLHADRPGRPGLALDLMEEFRPWLADRLALSLVNRKQVMAKDFQTTESNAVSMSKDAKKIVLKAWQEKKTEAFMHPFLQEKTYVGLMPLIQAQLFSRWLRGDLNAYPPILLK